jgi:RNA-directed DNA polymerase
MSARGLPRKSGLFLTLALQISGKMRGVAEDREGAHMLDTFRGTRTLRFLWHEQRGLCTLCNTKITRITGWRLHYCVSRVKGGSTGATNCVLLHPECHDRVHRQRLSVSKPRLP